MNNHQPNDSVASVARFPLLRYFLVTSILVVGSITALSAFFLANGAVDRFIQETERKGNQEASHFASMFYNVVWMRNQAAESDLTISEVDPLDLEMFAKNIAFGLSIARVSVLDLEGRVVYSTDPSLIGAPIPIADRYRSVVDQGVTSSFVERDKRLTTIEGEDRALDVVTMLAPLWDAGPVRTSESDIPIGVLEVTTDVSEGLNAIERDALLVAVLGSLVTAAALVGLLFLVVLRADRVIARAFGRSAEQSRLLRESGERLRSVISGAPIALWAVDEEGVVTFADGQTAWSPGAILARAVGRSVFDMEGMPVRVQEDHRLALAGNVRASLVVFGNGTFDMRYTPVHAKDGRITGVIGVATDVSDLMRAKDELQATNHRLEQTLEELGETQRQVAQQERLQALGQMASGIAHDFNNALVPIVGFTDLLLTRADYRADEERLVRYLELMGAAATDATAVVGRMREFYRTSDDPVTQKPVDLGDIITQAVELTRSKWNDEALARGASVRVETEVEEGLITLGNESGLRQALTNLIMNAADAMPDGGTIGIRGFTREGEVELEVSDTGVGMTPEVRQRCLEPFFTTKGPEGTGMGLAMVYGVVQRHGGTLEIRDNEGPGTTFSIRLSAYAAEQEMAGGEARGPTPSRRLRVLAIDDEPGVLEVVAEYLRTGGHEVVTATGGAEGIEKFAQGVFDLVITDRAMPEVTGDQLAAAVKQHNPSVSVIMLTGFGDIMEAAGNQPANVDLLVSKPVTLQRLWEAIEKVI